MGAPTDRPPSPPGVLDRATFEEEALQHAEQLYRIGLRLSGSSQVAEDLVQETYLRAFRNRASFRPGSNLAAWMATILRNAYLDDVRRASRRPVSEPIDETTDYYLYNRLAQQAEASQQALLDRLSSSDVLDSLAELPPNFREVVVLVDIGDFSYADAAEILGIPIGTVMSRLHRGRRLLKRALADHVAHPEEA
ncbi:MAG TPA: sigma-70 family RNA polymerase sigma factor [Gaiellales bacterium]|nr:sigma-70 family RNA polymerase sigma factor [Gaiellales bacterium]